MSNEKRMSHEELLEKLREMGVFKKGQKSGEVNIPRDIRGDEIEYVRKGKQMIQQVESLLEMQIEADQQLVQDLHLKIKKIKHGGGL